MHYVYLHPNSEWVSIEIKMFNFFSNFSITQYSKYVLSEEFIPIISETTIIKYLCLEINEYVGTKRHII